MEEELATVQLKAFAIAWDRGQPLSGIGSWLLRKEEHENLVRQTLRTEGNPEDDVFQLGSGTEKDLGAKAAFFFDGLFELSRQPRARTTSEKRDIAALEERRGAGNLR